MPAVDGVVFLGSECFSQRGLVTVAKERRIALIATKSIEPATAKLHLLRNADRLLECLEPSRCHLVFASRVERLPDL